MWLMWTMWTTEGQRVKSADSTDLCQSLSWEVIHTCKMKYPQVLKAARRHFPVDSVDN